MRESQWAADVVTFAKAEWGKNLVSLVLHQDEKTPHFQAFVVPICASGSRGKEMRPQPATMPRPTSGPGRLSARDLFSPATLAQLQTDFADAVAAHGFERGIAGSRAHHKTMREMYALQGKAAAEIAPLVEPVSVQKFELEKPPVVFSRGDWRAETEAKINEEITRQVGEANTRLVVAGQAAVAAAGGNEASDRSRSWVAAEKERGERSAEKLAASEAALAEMTKRVAALTTEQTQYAVSIAGGVLPQGLVETGTWMRELLLTTEAQPVVDSVLRAGRMDSRANFFAQVEAKGYKWKGKLNGTPEEGHFYQKKEPYARFTPAELRTKGERPLFEVVDAIIEERRVACDAAQAAADTAKRLREQHEAATRRTEQLATLEIFKSVYRKNSIYPSIRLLVEPAQVARVVTAFRKAGASVVERGWINAETNKTEGDKVGYLMAVHITHSLDRSPVISRLLDQAQTIGVEVYEPVHDQNRREQEARKPREQSPVGNQEKDKNYDREM